MEVDPELLQGGHALPKAGFHVLRLRVSKPTEKDGMHLGSAL